MGVANNSTLAAATQGFAQLPARSKIGLIIALAALAAVVSGSWMWSQTPDYRLLFANVSDRDGGAIIAALGQMNVPYKFTDSGGAIMVPANMVHDARLKLASQGLPKGGSVGFELMEGQKFGTTQFQEQVNFQRALEGELARTIQALSAVAAARVHLAMPKQSAFLRAAQKPSASVLVTLHAGKTLDRTQIAGIAHLVASSVPELSSRAVSVIDQHGALLSGNGERKGAGELDANQLSYVGQLEANLNKRIQDILEPVVGRNNVRVQVSAEVDFAESESVAESFRPNQNPTDAAIRHQQLSEEPRASAGTAQGVPGALSNQPPSTPVAPLSGAAANTRAPLGALPADAAAATRRDSTVNYELDKTVRHTRNPNGTVKRLSAAVVVNYRKTVDATPPPADDAAKPDDAPKAAPAKAKASALSAEEMTQITTLVKESIGYSQARGDSVNVVNMAFSNEESEVLPEIPLWQQADVLALARDIGRNALLAGLALYLVMGVLRPLIRQLATARPAELPQQVETQQVVSSGQLENRYNDNLHAVRQIAKQDPKVVAGVVRNWVGSDG